MADDAVRADSHSDLIALLDEAKHGLQLVHPIGASSEHMQKEVQFSRGRKPLQTAGYFHCAIASRSSIPG